MSADVQASLGIVVAVRNEETALPGLLASIVRQHGLERVVRIAVVDGRSEDRSREIAESFRAELPMLRVVDNPRMITPVAFNLGARACLDAGADAVLIVSAHSWLEPGFLVETARAIRSSKGDIVGAVHCYPPATGFALAAQLFSESRLGRRLGGLTRLDQLRETDVAFTPTIRREVFAALDGFDESLARNQDNDFTARARAAGFIIVTDPNLRYGYIPRQQFRPLLRQMRGNGYWVGMRPHVHGLRHATPFLFYAAVLLSGLLALWVGSPWNGLLLLLLIVYVVGILFETAVLGSRVGTAAFWLPILFVGGHACYAWGTLTGLTRLVLRRPVRS